MTDLALTPLREDLSLLQGPVAGGAPTWTIYDPARHRYVRVGWLEFEILTRWHLRTPEAILRSLGSETTLRATENDIAHFAAFASTAGLLKMTSPTDTTRLAMEAGPRHKSIVTWLIHNYLFLRIRLVNPDRFLTALLPVVRPMFTIGGVAGIVALGAFGLFLISREWDAYTHSLVEQYTIEGLLGMGVALSISKVFHELGHGFAAKRFGCRVPSMGIAFLVLWPVLWTDTTDAWRLADRRQRLVIDVAGMVAEITIAALASIAWAILPDGPARSAMFVLSSTTWILTLFVNIVPFLRFDGYYIFSDLLDIPNLQERAFGYTRWSLRELLFRPGLPPPEPAPPDMARIFVVFSIACWIYRFTVFIGIALLVYHLTFKALGIVLAAIELWFFIARPIVAELKAWVKVGVPSRSKRKLVMLAGLALLLLLFLVPWHGQIAAPGLLRADRQAVLLATEPGRLVAMVSPNAHVTEGDELFRLDSIEVTHAIALARAQLDTAQAELTSSPFDPDRRRGQQTSYARVSEAAAALLRAETRSQGLSLSAPFAGQLRDMPPDLRIGDDLKRLERLGVLVSNGMPTVEAYVAEPDIDEVAIGARAKLILLDGRTLALIVTEIGHVSTRTLDVPELASTNEGPIPVRRGPSSTLVPDRAIYRVTLTSSDASLPTVSRLGGRVVIDGIPRSAAGIVYRKVVALILRESSL